MNHSYISAPVKGQQWFLPWFEDDWVTSRKLKWRDWLPGMGFITISSISVTSRPDVHIWRTNHYAFPPNLIWYIAIHWNAYGSAKCILCCDTPDLRSACVNVVDTDAVVWKTHQTISNHTQWNVERIWLTRSGRWQYSNNLWIHLRHTSAKITLAYVIKHLKILHWPPQSYCDALWKIITIGQLRKTHGQTIIIVSERTRKLDSKI